MMAVSFGEALREWARIGLLSFGGPAGQISLMHRELVERKRWISEERFLHALNYCMLLPGPEAQQLAIYVGWLLHGTAGGLVAGTLFVLPGAVTIFLLSWLYAAHGHVGWVAGLFYGIKPAVIAIVVDALVRIGGRALRNGLKIAVAAGSFVAIFLYGVPFPIIVLTAGLLGLTASSVAPALLAGPPTQAEGAAPPADPPRHPPTRLPISPWNRTLRLLAVWLPLWAAPIVLLSAVLGPDHLLVREGTFFARAAMVTFGGAYAVLAYVAQAVVERYGWLHSGEMLDGLGLAESTPGPLIMVLQFVGFLAAWRRPGPFSPFVAGLLGSLVVTWVTFVPCFLWIFLGAPFIERLRGRVRLTAALSCITAAVVGVILNLSIWLALFTLFRRVDLIHVLGGTALVPHAGSVDAFGLALSVGAFLVLRRWKSALLPVLLAAGGLGALSYLAIGRP